MTVNTTQINLRIPYTLRNQARAKAKDMWTNLNFLIKLFLLKFVSEENIIDIQTKIDWDKIFNQGMTEYFSSEESKNIAKEIMNEIDTLDEEKYMV